MVKKFILISGKSGAGKTTISYELAKVLPSYVFVDIWKIKEMFEHLNLKDRRHNEIAKEEMYSIIRKALKLKITDKFILQESKPRRIKKHLKRHISKKDLIYSFYLDVSLEDALKRNVSREKDTMSKKHFIDQSKNNLPKVEAGDILINTSKMSKKQVIDFILKNVGEKRGKSVNVRRCL